MFVTESDVIRALRRYQDQYDPRSTSLMAVGSGPAPVDSEPFRPGFLGGLEERAELERRLSALEARDAALLLMWYAQSRPVTHIARVLDVSRVHCYRLRRKALERMVDERASLTPARAIAAS